MLSPKLVIESPSILDNQINEIFDRFKKTNYPALECNVQDEYSHLMIGKGSSHIWIKRKSDPDTRLAIIYL